MIQSDKMKKEEEKKNRAGFFFFSEVQQRELKNHWNSLKASLFVGIVLSKFEGKKKCISNRFGSNGSKNHRLGRHIGICLSEEFCQFLKLGPPVVQVVIILL